MKEHSIDIQLSHPDDLFHLWFNERHLLLMEEARCGDSCPWLEIVQVFKEKKLPVRKPSGYSGFVVLVNRGMTVGARCGDCD